MFELHAAFLYGVLRCGWCVLFSVLRTGAKTGAKIGEIDGKTAPCHGDTGIQMYQFETFILDNQIGIMLHSTEMSQICHRKVVNQKAHIYR